MTPLARVFFSFVFFLKGSFSIYITTCEKWTLPIGWLLVESSQEREEDNVMTEGWQGTRDLGVLSQYWICGSQHRNQQWGHSKKTSIFWEWGLKTRACKLYVWQCDIFEYLLSYKEFTVFPVRMPTSFFTQKSKFFSLVIGTKGEGKPSIWYACFCGNCWDFPSFWSYFHSFCCCCRYRTCKEIKIQTSLKTCYCFIQSYVKNSDERTKKSLVW